MARTSLVVLGLIVLTASGCLVVDNPVIPEPDAFELRPILTNLSPSPAKIAVIPRVRGSAYLDKRYVQNQVISFTVSSADRQRPVEWFVLRDFAGYPNTSNSGEDLRRMIGVVEEIPVSELMAKGGASRSRTLTPLYDIEPGCHSISLVASHEFRTASANPVNPDDIAIATWWYQFGVVDENDVEGESKPCKPNPIPSDAGADALFMGGLP